MTRAAQAGAEGRVCWGAIASAARCVRWPRTSGGGAVGRLVVRGEAGIGKTALLRYLIESASDLTVARAVGVESEMELPFASLHQLSGPMLDRLERLPAPQREALEIVFALSAAGGTGSVSGQFGSAESVLGGCGGRSAVVRCRRRTMA